MGRRATVWAAVVCALLCCYGALGAEELLHEHRDGSVGHLTAQGMTAHQQGKLDQAIQFYERALGQDKNYFPALFNLALAYQQQGDVDRARNRYLEALQIRPDHPEVHCNLGVLAFGQGRYQEAVSRFGAAAQVMGASDAETADYLFNLGTAHEALQEWVPAQKAYLRCLDLAPAHFAARYNLGTLYLHRLDNPRQAEVHLKRAVKSDPSRPEPLVNLGVLAEKRKDPEAEAYYTQAVEVARRTHRLMLPKLLWLRSRFYDRQLPPQKVKMRKDLQEILELDPAYPGANGSLGLYYETMGRLDEAITLLEREVAGDAFDEKNPIDLECIYVLAVIFFDSRPEAEKALKYAMMYYKLRPDTAKANDLRRRTLNRGVRLPSTTAPGPRPPVPPADGE